MHLAGKRLTSKIARSPDFAKAGLLLISGRSLGLRGMKLNERHFRYGGQKTVDELGDRS